MDKIKILGALIVPVSIVALSLAGCASIPMMGMEESVCVKRPPEFADSKSHICLVSQKIQIPPEEVNNLLLDASAMAYVTDQVEKEEIAKFLDKVEGYISPVCGGKTYDNVLGFISLDAQKSALLMRVINRRLRFYSSTEPISDFDCWMSLKAITYQKEQFGL